MKLYWKVKRNGKWQWVPAARTANYVWLETVPTGCECKACVPGTTDGDE